MNSIKKCTYQTIEDDQIRFKNLSTNLRLRMAKLQTFKLTNKAETLKYLGTPIKLLKTLLHVTGNLSTTVL